LQLQLALQWCFQSLNVEITISYPGDRLVAKEIKNRVHNWSS
jgi:hypothetical protein